MKNIDKAVEISVPMMRSMFKRNSMRFAAALLVALASFVAAPNAALAAEPQHHDQVPGFYRLKVGDLEVTALLDGSAVADPHWLNGEALAQSLHYKRCDSLPQYSLPISKSFPNTPRFYLGSWLASARHRPEVIRRLGKISKQANNLRRLEIPPPCLHFNFGVIDSV